ncbi:MAG: DNA methylase [Firmicutes bacterium]|nr:DNA methylase [Ezakiella sp.]MDD7761181.1 DNA methylase [Bacillota bacterium]
MDRVYIAIDLKSFYASVECVERGLDPLNTNLVVADSERTNKTICLAVSPALKTFGVPGRPRLFEVEKIVNDINCKRNSNNNAGSIYLDELNKSDLKVDYIIARPRMAYYIEYSTRIIDIYLKYVSERDIHVYSIDEVFIDATNYLHFYNHDPHKMALTIVKDVLKETGITATAGIGSNLYLAKIAMDIVAKHQRADKDGVRIAELDERKYRELLWAHTPITDFWRVGKGIANRLKKLGLYTMGDIARASIGGDDEFYNENLLYKTFGINAELLIDHAWGVESCTISDIKNYRPSSNSISSGQVLTEAYSFEKARLVAWEMADGLSLDLVKRGLVTNKIILAIGFDIDNLTNPEIMKNYSGEIVSDGYGRKVPKGVNARAAIKYTSSSSILTNTVCELFDKIVDDRLLIRRITITAEDIIAERDIPSTNDQISLFVDNSNNINIKRERKIQETMLKIKQKYGKNAIMRAKNLEDGATAMERNRQIGGHRE